MVATIMLEKESPKNQVLSGQPHPNTTARQRDPG
jgi:hypothetical protein